MDKSSKVEVTNPAKAGLNTVQFQILIFPIPVILFSLSFPIFDKAKFATQQKVVVAQNRKLRPEAAHSKHIAIEAFVPYLISIHINFNHFVKHIAQNRSEVIILGVRTGHGLS
jgi:hypothetical protein